MNHLIRTESKRIYQKIRCNLANPDAKGNRESPSARSPNPNFPNLKSADNKP